MENITAVITQESAKISCNFEQVKEAIRERLSEFENAVFTEDSKNFAKKEVAKIRKEKKSFQDNLKDAKKKYMAPWDEVESQAKKLLALYDETINYINGQVQEIEEKRIAEKKQLISEMYAAVPDDIQPYIPLESIYNPKWENATYKEKDIRKDICELVDKTQNDINTIQSMNSDSVAKAMEMYRGSLNLADAISYINNYERQKQEILERERERKRLEEEERIRRAERERILAEQRAKEELQRAEEEKAEALRRAEIEKEEALRRAEEEKAAAVEMAKAEAEQEVIDSFIPEEEAGEEERIFEFRLLATPKVKESVCMFMDSIGVEWEMI